MSENQHIEISDKRIEQDKIIYLLNEVDKTAFVISNNKAKGEIIIPRSIHYESNEYIVLSILKHAFQYSQIESIKFSQNSEIKTIKGKAFCNSSIESLMIPSSLIDLEDGWCAGTSKLTKIIIDPNNPRYSKYDDKIIIGKSSFDTPNYDSIVFCNRDVKTIAIPKFIKHIESHSFGRCNQLHQFDIPSDSELQTIGNHAFFKSSIENLMIPNNVIKIGESAFSRCIQLERINFQSDSKLEIIDKFAFSKSSIRHFSIPCHLKQISEYSFSNCNKLIEIVIPKNSELKAIETKAFYNSPIRSLMIPASLFDLNDGWCAGTSQLIRVEIDSNNPRYLKYDDKMVIGKSSLEIINYDSIVFCNRDVEIATIPKFIKHVGSYSFNQCNQLRQLNIPSDSVLKTIGNHAFSNSSIENFIIPNNVIKIGEYSFADCKQLQTVEISIHSELQEICKYAFSKTSIKSFIIQHHVTKIGEYAFAYCKQFQTLEIAAESKLKEIGKYAFCDSSIERLMIPSSLINLDKKWCAGTSKLTRIDVDPNNKLYSSYDNKIVIGKSSLEMSNFDTIIFCNRDVEVLTIPNFIKYIGINAFDSCQKLQNVETTVDSELLIINKLAFYNSSIESLTIPSSLIDLEEGWCAGSFNLTRVEIDPNNPRYLNYDKNIVIGKSSLEVSNYDVIVFCNRDAEIATIPIFIKHIGYYSFDYCIKLCKIEIQNDSELQTIGDFAFNNTSIENFTIPPHVTHIGRFAFLQCKKLQKISISKNSELKTIDECAFCETKLESISIPRHITQIGNSAFLKCENLHIIEIDINSELENFDQNSFGCENAIIMIPSNLNYFFRI